MGPFLFLFISFIANRFVRSEWWFLDATKNENVTQTERRPKVLQVENQKKSIRTFDCVFNFISCVHKRFIFLITLRARASSMFILASPLLPSVHGSLLLRIWTACYATLRFRCSLSFMLMSFSPKIERLRSKQNKNKAYEKSLQKNIFSLNDANCFCFLLSFPFNAKLFGYESFKFYRYFHDKINRRCAPCIGHILSCLFSVASHASKGMIANARSEFTHFKSSGRIDKTSVPISIDRRRNCWNVWLLDRISSAPNIRLGNERRKSRRQKRYACWLRTQMNRKKRPNSLTACIEITHISGSSCSNAKEEEMAMGNPAAQSI